MDFSSDWSSSWVMNAAGDKAVVKWHIKVNGYCEGAFNTARASKTKRNLFQSTSMQHNIQPLKQIQIQCRVFLFN